MPKRPHPDDEEKPNISNYDSSVSDETSDDDNDEINEKASFPERNRQRLTSTDIASTQQLVEKIRKPAYEIIEGIFQKAKRKRLIIFSKENRKLCYEYSWSKSANRYLCCGCKSLNEKVVRAFIQNENTDNEYIKICYNEHVCSPREYATLKIHEKTENIIHPPDFVIQTFVKYGVERKRLFVFDPQNRELGHEYVLQKTTGNFICHECCDMQQYVVAKYFCNENGNEYIELSEEEHICNLRPYKTIDEQQDIILSSSEFTIYPDTNEQKLFVFTSKEKGIGYEFASTAHNKTYFQCLGCVAERKPAVHLKLCQATDDSSSESFLQMVPNQKHVCKLRKYTPDKWKQVFIYPPNFIFYTRNSSKTVNLIVFDPSNKKLCYDFQCEGKAKFYCKECRKKKMPTLSCTLAFDDEGKEYLKLKSQEHRCKPLKFSNWKTSGGIKIQETSGLKIEKVGKIDESRIVKEGKFELRSNRAGILDARLILFYLEDIKLCYEYSYQKFRNKYICNKCSNVFATLCVQENGSKFIELGENEHTCKPFNYNKEELQIVHASSFIIHPSTKKHIVSKMILFTSSEDRSLCYIYYHNGQCKNYYCRACFVATKKKIVTAKLLKNDNNEDYLLLSKFQHCCIPQSYDPTEFKETPKIPASRFEILYNTHTRSRIFVFDVNDPFLAHVFAPVSKFFQCRGCREAKKYTAAKVCTDGNNGEQYIEVDESRHICLPENLLKSEMIVEKERFEESVDSNGNQMITTFHDENKSLCRTFTFDNQLQTFQCLKCIEKDRIVTAKICKRNDTKEEYLLLYSKHICKPIPRITESSACRSKKKREGVQLLAFDDNQKLNYSGFCKLSLNFLSKYLIVDPKIEEVKPLSVSFDSNIVQEKQIMFVDSGVQKFVLVFASKVICKKVFDGIYENSDKTQNSNTPQRSFKDDFLIPLFNEYSNNADIAKIINNLIDEYNDQERNEIIQYLQEKTTIHQDLWTKISSVTPDNVSNCRHGSSRAIELESAVNSNANDAASGNNNPPLNDAEDVNDDVEIYQRRKKQRVISKIRKKIKKSDYQLVKGMINGEKKTRLIIFDKTDRKLCYEFHWSKHDQAFHCCGCNSLRERSVRAAIHHANTKNEYVECRHVHVCQPREYANLKILKKKHILKSPDFELQTIMKNGKERKYLIVFEPTNRSLCYKYSVTGLPVFTCQRCAYLGHHTRAYLRVDKNGIEYVELGEESHTCDLLPYIPVNANPDIIFESSHFEIFQQSKSKPKLFIFESLENKKQGYEFSHLKKNIYNCLACSKIPGAAKFITVELCQKEENEGGEYFVRMKSNLKHKCELREYQPRKWKEIFIYPPNFMFYTKGTTKHPQLIIFCSEDKKYCYDYKFTCKNFMKCKACHRKKHGQSVLILQDSEGKEYLQLGSNEHICDPVEYEDVEGTGLQVLPSSGIKYQKEIKKKKIDENKIVKDDGFTIIPEENGTTKLFIFDKNDKTLCYKYSLQKKGFYCLKCHLLNLTVSAKLYANDDDGKQYIVLGEKNHICEPVKYEPKNISTKIVNFKVFEANKKRKTSKLVIFKPSNPSFCYVYTYCNGRKHFKCYECNASKTRKIVSTKILKDENGQDYVLLREFDHVCKAFKYNSSDFEELPKIPSPMPSVH